MTQAVLYASKDAKKSYYSIPSMLCGQDVLKILLDHSHLASILWPAPRTGEDQRNGISEKKQVAPHITEIRIGPTSGSGPGKASITSHEEAREVVVQEDMPLGIKMTLVYRLCNRPVETEAANSDPPLSGLSSGLYLEEQRSVLAPRPFSFLVKVEDRLILKTRNLLCVLEEFGRNGRDLGAALGFLSGRPGDCSALVASLEKNKAD